MAENAIRERLLDGERVIWEGSPRQGFILTPRDVFLIPFSLVWCGFAVFWIVMATRDHAPPFFVLFGVPFVFAGLYIVFGRFLVDAWARRTIRYAVTDRRILIVGPGSLRRFTALPLAQMPVVSLREHRSGRGTIRFGMPTPFLQNENFGGWSPVFDPTPQFVAIDDASRVFNLIQRSVGK